MKKLTNIFSNAALPAMICIASEGGTEEEQLVSRSLTDTTTGKPILVISNLDDPKSPFTGEPIKGEATVDVETASSPMKDTLAALTCIASCVICAHDTYVAKELASELDANEFHCTNCGEAVVAFYDGDLVEADVEDDEDNGDENDDSDSEDDDADIADALDEDPDADGDDDTDNADGTDDDSTMDDGTDSTTTDGDDDVAGKTADDDTDVDATSTDDTTLDTDTDADADADATGDDDVDNADAGDESGESDDDDDAEDETASAEAATTGTEATAEKTDATTGTEAEATTEAAATTEEAPVAKVDDIPATHADVVIATVVNYENESLKLASLSDTSRYEVFLGNNHIGSLLREQASANVQAAFAKTDFIRNALSTSFFKSQVEVASGKFDALKDFGFQPVVHKIALDKVVASEIQKATDELEAQNAEKIKEATDAVVATTQIAMAGIQKGVLDGPSFSAELAAILTTHGVKHADDIASRFMEKHGEPYFKAVVANAEKLRSETPDFVRGLNTMIEKASYSSKPAKASDESPYLSTSALLPRSEPVRHIAPAARNVETASTKKPAPTNGYAHVFGRIGNKSRSS